MASVPMIQKDSIVDQLEQLHQRVARRAYELFRGRDTLWGDAWADWFTAERETVWAPPVELREKDGAFTVEAALAGVDPKDMNVEIAPQNLVIKATTEHSHSEDKGQVHQCEFVMGQLFRSVRFPKPIDVTKARAEYRNGLLTVTVPIVAEAQAKRLDVKAA